MITVEDSLNRLDDISRLKKNWNGYDAEPFSKRLIDKCRTIVTNIPHQLEIFPASGNVIQFEWDFPDGGYIEFDVDEDKTDYFYIPPYIADDKDECTFQGDRELDQIVFEIDKILDTFDD